ncbi:DUF4012 domain-containing protein [Candidatus Microgenomates bacterium]|nr:MAG: DUF4012 domain-containing protein [Candidatus Microgenomates bacterium]
MRDSAPKSTGRLLLNDSILVLDKGEIIGNSLAEKLSELFVNKAIVLVSKIGGKEFKNKLYIPYHKRIPSIPHGIYSLIFLVFQGEKDLINSLPQFAEKVEKQKGRIIFIIPIAFVNEDLIRKLSYIRNLQTVMVGDLFSEIFEKTDQEIGSFFAAAKKGGSIILAGLGMEKIYPVALEDVVLGILDISLKPQGSKIYSFFPKDIPTKLATLRIFRKINPNLKIDFSKESKKQKKELQIEGEYYLGEKYPLEQKIRQVLEKFNLDEAEAKRPVKKNKFSNFKIPLKNNLFFVLMFFLFLLTLPLISSIFFIFLGGYELRSVKIEIEKSNLSRARKSADFAKTFFNFADKSNQIYLMETKVIGNPEILGQGLLKKGIKLGQDVSGVAVDLANAYEKLVKVGSGKSNNPKEDFVFALNSLKNTMTSFQQIKTEIGAEDTKRFLPKGILPNQEIENLIRVISSSIDVFPNIFGLDGEKHYLILFQNNMELRPGGGFIGSYGLLTLDKGKVRSFVINDVYDADGQLKGHIEPPYAIRRHLPVVHWYLRDSNFDIDFTKNASNAAFFLNQEKGDVVDGVIGVDISFVKNLLSVTGPIKVLDYKETITSENLYLLTQKYAEKNTFAGSSQKKDFLKSLFNALEQNFLEKNNFSYLELGKVIASSISQKHLLFAFANPTIQSSFTVNGMSSSLWDKREESTGAVNDFLGVNEANIGVNKANYFIKRKISQEVIVNEKGEIGERVNIYYMNTGSAWPGGDYKNYLRLVLPLGAKISSVQIDGEEQKTIKAIKDFIVYEKKNFKAPKELEIDETQENGKSIFGFLIVVPTDKLKKITVSYAIPQKINLDEPSSFYSHWIFKQPGTEDDQYSFSLLYPETLKAFDVPKEFSSEEGKVSLSTKLLSDIEFKIGLGKK